MRNVINPAASRARSIGLGRILRYVLRMARHDKTPKALAITMKQAAPKLGAARRADIRKQNNPEAIEASHDLFRQKMAGHVPPKTSGSVEIYRILFKEEPADAQNRNALICAA